MIVLGYNGFSNAAMYFDAYMGRRGRDRNRLIGHDAAAAIFKDGVLVAAAEEERFTRIKKTSQFPRHAIAYCLEACGATLADVDYIAFPWDYTDAMMSEIFGRMFHGPGTLEEKFQRFNDLRNLYFHLISPQRVREDFNLSLHADVGPEKFVFVPHHLAHLMTGFFVSGMEESAFLITDGRAELLSSVMGTIDRNDYTIFHGSSIGLADSLGILYANMTRYLGYTPNSDEYKVMALSSFAQNPPDYDYEQVIELRPDGTYKLHVENNAGNILAYYTFFENFFGPRSEENDQNAAFFIQTLTERAIAHQIKTLEQKTNCTNLILDGGVALNCVNNSKVLASSRFEDVHIGFAANDCGVTIGAAFYPFYQQKIFADNQAITPYLGPSYSRQDMLHALESRSDRVHFEELSEERLLEVVCNELMSKKIIGWFQGSMEYGPRALGNRSILANPVFDDMKDFLNMKVKYREPFRPFAGVLIESDVHEYFEMGKKQTSPYMTFVFEAKPAFRDKIPGAIHIDGTSRLQTVSHEQNPKLYALLKKFAARAEVPCLVNTSFNVQGEPIVCSPTDAVNCFLNSGIDVLVLGNFLAYKR
jgi:carbamoyltransferase